MKGAIFDMDGLLLDSERVYQRIWRELAAEAGVTLDDTFPAAICGTTGAGTEAVLRRYLPGEEPKAVMAECRRRREGLLDSIPLKPGAAEILSGLKQSGFRVALASSSGREVIERHLKRTGIGVYFDAVVSGGEVPRGKPFPDIFIRAAAELGLDAGDCYVFEDSYNGIRAARAVGCRPVMIPDLLQPTREIRALCHGVWPDLSAAWRDIGAETEYIGQETDNAAAGN